MKRSWNAVLRILQSRLGNLLAVVNTCILLYEFWYWGELASSRFHFYTLSATFQFMLLINIPSMFLSGVISVIFSLISEIRPQQSAGQTDIGVFIAISAMQWQLIGFIIGRLFSKPAGKSTPLP